MPLWLEPLTNKNRFIGSGWHKLYTKHYAKFVNRDETTKKAETTAHALRGGLNSRATVCSNDSSQISIPLIPDDEDEVEQPKPKSKGRK